MNKFGILIGSVLTFGLIGCGSSSSSNPAPVDNTTGGVTPDTTSTTTSTGGTVGDNPGVLRAPVLAEPTSIELLNLGGHQVFAGPDERFFEGYSYVNIDFGCDGNGTFELYPAEAFASFQAIIRGTIAWTVDTDGEDVDVAITQVTEGDGGVGEFEEDSLSVNPVSAGSLIIGQSTFQSKIVDHISQYEACG